MTNLSQETLLEFIEKELPRAERYYKENQLWKEGGVSKVLQPALKRCAIQIRLIFLFLLGYVYLLILNPPEQSNKLSMIVPGLLILMYFLPKLRSHQRLKVLSELWDEIAEADEATLREDEPLTIESQCEMIE